MHIKVSFHSPSSWRSTRAGISCLVAGLLAALSVAGTGWVMHEDMSRWKADLKALRNQGAADAVASDGRAQPEIGTELLAANQIIARLNTPWSALFLSLEEVYSDNSILLGVEPDPVARSIRLTGEAKDAASMLEFVRQLRAAKVFSDAYVISHAINQNDVQHPIRFSVASRWLDVASEQAAARKPSEDEGPATHDAARTVLHAEKPEGET